MSKNLYVLLTADLSFHTKHFSKKQKKNFFFKGLGILCAWGFCSAACVKTTALFGISENH